MSVAERLISDDADEARGRIDLARIRDTAFFIARALRPKVVPRPDLDLLAEIVVRAQDAGAALTPAYLKAEILKRGRSLHMAEQIVSALFK